MKLPFQGSLRLQSAASATRALAADRIGGKGDDALARLAKLAPAEIMTVYLAGKAAWPNNTAEIGLVLVVICLVWRWWTTSQPGKPVQWMAILAATVSFALWVYASGGSIWPGGPLDAMKTSFAALVWTVLIAPNLPGNKGD